MIDDLKQMADEVATLLEEGNIQLPSKEQMVRVFRNLRDVLGMAEELEQQRDELMAALKLAVYQNSYDMIMTGEELRLCEAALARVKESK